MATITKKSYDQNGNFIDLITYDADTDEPIKRDRYLPYNNWADVVNDDLGDHIETEVYNP